MELLLIGLICLLVLTLIVLMNVKHSSNKINILLYKNDVTIDDCLILSEKYGMSTIIDSGDVLGFASD
jgi:hypothetical protein